MSSIIGFIHLLCLVFLVFGFLFNSPITYVHLLAIPLVIVQWWFNNNQCILTQLQNKFNTKIEDPFENLEGNFTRDLLSKVGLTLTDKQLQILIYAVLFISWTLSLKKLL